MTMTDMMIGRGYDPLMSLIAVDAPYATEKAYVFRVGDMIYRQPLDGCSLAPADEPIPFMAYSDEVDDLVIFDVGSGMKYPIMYCRYRVSAKEIGEKVGINISGGDIEFYVQFISQSPTSDEMICQIVDLDFLQEHDELAFSLTPNRLLMLDRDNLIACK